ASHKIEGTTFRTIYVEAQRKRYKKLKSYLDEKCPAYIEHHALHGDYAVLQDDILSRCGNGFTFFFIDPKGWTDVGMPKLSKLLRRPNSEFFITFMYDPLNRFLSKNKLREQVSQLLGDIDEKWIANLQSMEPKKREEEVVRRYRDQLVSTIGGTGANKPRSYHATVLNKDKNKTIYHMVYLTRHPKGILEFSRISEKVEIIQRRVRYERREKCTGQMNLIPIEDSDLRDQFAADIEDVKQFWMDRLSSKPTSYNEADLADWLEQTGWLENDFQLAFKELQKEKQVENVSDTSNRRKKWFVHFNKSERLRRCV
ncbi:MAG TPA: three-Cys-motif partner protein TcmP, partial [Gammaproteobacteria bacterium]|nr:three-Cys-motif partner protein TcmP [Gammaproteobacteria bacterium]